MSKKHNSSRRRRRRLFALNPHCFFCERRLTFDESTLDHLIPRSKGGKNVDTNVVLSCYKCNNDKRDYYPTQDQIDRLVQRPPIPSYIELFPQSLRLCCGTSRDLPHKETCIQVIRKCCKTPRGKPHLAVCPEAQCKYCVAKQGAKKHTPGCPTSAWKMPKTYASQLDFRKCCKTIRGKIHDHEPHCKNFDILGTLWMSTVPA